MKMFWKISFIAMMTLTVIVLFIHWLGRDLQKAMVANPVNVNPVREFDMRTQRLELEKEQLKNIESYQWIDKRKGHVQIPVERAFDYYLRTLRR